jgi:hypothetical protein
MWKTIEIDGSEFHPVFLSNVLFCRVFKKHLTLFMTKLLKVLVLSFPDFTDNSIV